MSDPIRDALIELVNAVNEQFFGNNAIALSSRVITANNKAMRQLLRQPPAPVAWCNSGDLVAAAEKRQSFSGWRERHYDCDMALYAAPPPAPTPAPVANSIRAELEAVIAAYDEHGGRWPDEDVQALAGAVERARAALSASPPAPMAWPELPDCLEELGNIGGNADTVFARGLRLGYGYARQKLAAMNPNHRPENHQ